MTDELTARLEMMDVQLAQLTRRIHALEQAKPAAPAPAPAANGNRANGRTPEPRWLDFVKFGDKPCANSCGALVMSGRTRAWYEPANGSGTKGALFCEPCGKPRAAALGK
jgi:hypothetical protein